MFMVEENMGKDLIVEAIVKHGYRHIDGAMIYGNEKAIGEAVKECIEKHGIKREELFITTKLWTTDKHDVQCAVRRSLKNLGLKYIDLYLVHWMRPNIDYSKPEKWEIDSPRLEVVWREMEAEVMAGRIKSIGVSNCGLQLLMDLLTYCELTPAVNQIECHPYF